MNTQERKDMMLEAVESLDGFSRLRDVVVSLVEEGVTADILIKDMTDILALLSDENEDMMINVMDQLVGWCSDWARILPRPQSGEADYGLR